MVVIEPTPAIKGNARGTTEADFGSSSLMEFTLRTFCKARIKRIKAPAMAKELISKPSYLKIRSPRKRKPIITPAASILAFLL
jgi:hypothetical protein